MTELLVGTQFLNCQNFNSLGPSPKLGAKNSKQIYLGGFYGSVSSKLYGLYWDDVFSLRQRRYFVSVRIISNYFSMTM